MTNKEAINNLGQLYPIVSEEMKRTIDKAIEALDLTGKDDNCFHFGEASHD